jgi:hypothetical protein
MTIPNSTAPAVRQWLFDQCTAGLAPDPDNVRASLLVCFDQPGPNEPDDIVAIGRVHRQLSVGAMIGGGGAGWLDESTYSGVTTAGRLPTRAPWTLQAP